MKSVFVQEGSDIGSSSHCSLVTSKQSVSKLASCKTFVLLEIAWFELCQYVICLDMLFHKCLIAFATVILVVWFHSS